MSKKALSECPHSPSEPDDEMHLRLKSAPRLRPYPTCLIRARKNLAALPALYEDCVHAINPAPRGHSRERVSGSRSPQTLNHAAVETRLRIQTVLASWARMVADERRLIVQGGEVNHLAQFLATHLDWLAAHPVAPDFIHETDELVAGALNAIDAGSATRRIEIGACIEPGCSGLLIAWRPARGGRPPEVRCDAGQHVWRAHQWLLLRRRVEQARQA